PIDAARRSMHELIDSGSVSYAYVGIVTEDLTPSVASHFRLAVQRGALIDSVRGGSPGARAGLKGGTQDVTLNGQQIRLGGDVIVAIDGRPVTDSEDVLRIVTEGLRPGKAATFTVQRGVARLRLRVVPVERPENPNAG